MPILPKRFISNEAKVGELQTQYCSSCQLSRRTDLKSTLTPGEELGADVWKSQDIFGLSVNIILCNAHNLCEDCLRDDVNITPTELTDVPFSSDSQLDNIELGLIEYTKSDNLIIQMIIGAIECLNGTYPYKKGTPDEVTYNYRLEVEYIPFVLNIFHFEIVVLSDESGSWEIVNRKAPKKYIRALASKIRARLLDENKIQKLSV